MLRSDVGPGPVWFSSRPGEFRVQPWLRATSKGESACQEHERECPSACATGLR